MSYNNAISIQSDSRTRRTRMTERMRNLVRETHLEPSNFILPLFVSDRSANYRNEISSMPGVFQFGIDHILRQSERAVESKLGGIILFGITDDKDETGSSAHNEMGIVQQTVREIKKRFPELLVATDVCLCEYTSHGHCGIIKEHDGGEFEIANDETVEELVLEALSHAEAGSDLISPSDMMDGRIGAIREALDENGFEKLPIMSYSAKFASGFYGPFREAAGSSPSFGDRRSHQMDPANGDEAMRVIERDIREGADIIMVKPAMSYLDIIRRAKDEFTLPIAAYQVSGEYAMIKAASANGWLDEERVMMESLLSIKRAGAQIILTYFAFEAAKNLRS
ncbi:MAG: porphobilinogen synthase [Bacteroidota bacterium]|nr:porphobilinogen synthase [Bacteroidota bacterium]MDP4231642.1 porphobilinogen synthase [Bacteroidota bacterium]